MLLFLISLFYFLLVDYEFINAPLSLKQDFVKVCILMGTTDSCLIFWSDVTIQ